MQTDKLTILKQKKENLINELNNINKGITSEFKNNSFSYKYFNLANSKQNTLLELKKINSEITEILQIQVDCFQFGGQ